MKHETIKGNRIRINGNGTFNKADLKWMEITNSIGYLYKGLDGNYVLVIDPKKAINKTFKRLRYHIEKEYRKLKRDLDIKTVINDNFNSNMFSVKKFSINNLFETIVVDKVKKDGTFFKTDIENIKIAQKISEDTGHRNLFRFAGMTDYSRVVREFVDTGVFFSSTKKVFKQKALTINGEKNIGSTAQNIVKDILKDRNILYTREECVEFLFSRGLEQIRENLSIERLRSLDNISRAQFDFVILHPYTGKVLLFSLKGKGHSDKFDEEIEENKDILNYFNIKYILLKHEEGLYKGSDEKEKFIEQVLQVLQLNDVPVNKNLEDESFEMFVNDKLQNYINEGDSLEEATCRFEISMKKSYKKVQKNFITNKETI